MAHDSHATCLQVIAYFGVMHLGIPLGQGYYLGRPNPVMRPLHAECAATIRSRNQAHQRGRGLEKHLQVCSTELNTAAAQTLSLADSTG